MNNRHDKILFWGCFIALITTSYAFISRMILCGGQFATGEEDHTVELPDGSTDAALTPQHVSRSQQFIRERFGGSLLIDFEPFSNQRTQSAA